MLFGYFCFYVYIYGEIGVKKKVGALTSKPTAFNFRTWELNSIRYTSCQDSLMPSIRVDMFQKKIVRILPIEEWISDSQRFLFLNLDKQSFNSPALIFNKVTNFCFVKIKKLLRQHTYVAVMHYLVKKILKKRKLKLNLNLIVGSLFSSNLNIYNGLNTCRSKISFFYKNSFITRFSNSVSKYSAVLLLNLNPRLDSPLFNLQLKEIENVISIGNFVTNFTTISNNLKNLITISENSLLVFSDTLKNIDISYCNNDKLNLTPVYLNNSLVSSQNFTEPNSESINFYLNPPEKFDSVKNFNINFSTHVTDLNFDIFFPISNYFVSSGELISSKGVSKLKPLRPSFSLKDHISSLIMMLNNKVSLSDVFTKIFFFEKKKEIIELQNRLVYNYFRNLKLQKC